MARSKKITYRKAINEALIQEMERDERVFVYGIGVADHRRIFGTTQDLVERFGSARCFNTPLCEETLVGFGLGAALNGLRPVNIHARADFLMLAMNQIVNMVSSYHYGSAGKLKVPLTIRTIIGRGWGQSYQHNKSLHSFYAHIPGLIVVMPTTPADAKGLLISAIRSDNPVIIIEHRWLYDAESEVEEKPFETPFGRANILRKGNDLTLVATSWMNIEALKAAEILKKKGVEIEIIDPRTISPLDKNTILKSVAKTQRCIIADNDWLNCGFSAEISAVIAEELGSTATRVKRIGFAATPCPCTRPLENEFYPSAANMVREIEKLLGLKKIDLSEEDFYSYEKGFKGPF